MRTVTFQSVLNGAARRASLNPIGLDSGLLAQLAEYVTSWAKKGWEWEFWPEWTVLEQRQYRDTYNSATAYPAPAINAPVEVWFPPAQLYAQALQATTGHDPFVSINGAWVANCPYWELSTGSYSGQLWAPTTNFVQGVPGTSGTIVRSPNDDQFYECIITHTSGSSFDPTKFGPLTVFERYISLDQLNRTPIGEVSMVSRGNPRTNPRFPGPLKFIITNQGILPAPLAGAQVWVLFRLRPPQFTSEAYVSGDTYEEGDVVYQPATTGECYVSLIDANTGNTPEDNPAKWQKQDMPELIAEAVKIGAYAELIRSDSQNEKADDAEEKAKAKLVEASDVALGSQGQYERASAEVY